MKRWIIWILLVVSAGPTLADEADEGAKLEAKRLIEEGDKLFADGDAEGALDKYLAAHAAFPSPKIYYPLARAEEKLGRLGASLAHYEQFLADAGKTVSAALRKEAKRAADRLRKLVARVTFQVDVEGAVVTVDGRPVGSTPIDGVIFVDPGDRVFAAEAEGYKPARLEQTLAAGEQVEIILDMEEAAIEPPVVKPKPKPVPEPEPEPEPEPPPVVKRRSRTALWIGLGLTGAFTLGATITGIMAMGKHDDFEDESLPVPDREDARDSGKTLAAVTDVFLVGALASGAFTTWYYFARVRGRAAEPAVVVTPERAGIAISGRF